MRCTVLLGEDDEEARSAFLALLVGHGFAVREFADGESLLAAVYETPPPVVIVADLWMPGRTGYEVLEQLRRDNLLELIPFLIVSGEGAYFDKAYPEVPFLAKPVEPLPFLRLVERLAARALDHLPALEPRLQAVRKRRTATGG